MADNKMGTKPIYNMLMCKHLRCARFGGLFWRSTKTVSDSAATGLLRFLDVNVQKNVHFCQNRAKMEAQLSVEQSVVNCADCSVPFGRVQYAAQLSPDTS
jgi:hypothetical protein